MAAAMMVPFLLVLPPFWAGALGEGDLYSVGHGLMFLAMLGVMLRRSDEYTSHHSGHHSGRPTPP
jgi:flagellar biosynthetic protein FliP